MYTKKDYVRNVLMALENIPLEQAIDILCTGLGSVLSCIPEEQMQERLPCLAQLIISNYKNFRKVAKKLGKI